MNETQKPFDRREAFDIFLSSFPWDCTPDEAITESIKEAQKFNAAVEKAAPGKYLRESIRAERKYGSFAPHGDDLYFLTNDGVKCLICSFPTIELCALATLAMNAYLRFAEDMPAVDTPEDFYPEDCSHLHVGGEQS